MNNQITTYYIPSNPNIKSGPIYTLYINNNTNLDLTSILASKSNPKNLEQPLPKITLEPNEYNKLLNVSKQIQELINKKNTNVENFLKEEKQTINELSKLSIDYHNTLKNISVKGGKNE